MNGKDGPIPSKCARCKRRSWNGEQFTPKEIGLRRRIKGFNNLYSYRFDERMRNLVSWDSSLCEKFLNLKPRPTIEEMSQVIHSSPLGRISSAEIQSSKYIPSKPVPNRPGWYRRDNQRFDELVVQEAHIRKNLMLKIIENRKNI